LVEIPLPTRLSKRVRIKTPLSSNQALVLFLFLAFALVRKRRLKTARITDAREPSSFISQNILASRGVLTRKKLTETIFS
jgi:hypothetical protein